MAEDHKEPWKLRTGQYREIENREGESLMGDDQYYPWAPKRQEDWERIIACVNALAGIPTQDLIEKCEKCGWPVGLHGLTCKLLHDEKDEERLETD